MMAFVSHEMDPGIWMQESYQTMPDINGGPNRNAMSPVDLQATFPGMVQTANGVYTGDLNPLGGELGQPVHLGADGWMVGQDGCMVDGQVVQGPGVASVDLPDMSWCGVNDWVDRNKGLAAIGLVALFVATRAGARKIRERRARR